MNVYFTATLCTSKKKICNFSICCACCKFGYGRQKKVKEINKQNKQQQQQNDFLA